MNKIFRFIAASVGIGCFTTVVGNQSGYLLGSVTGAAALLVMFAIDGMVNDPDRQLEKQRDSSPSDLEGEL